MKKCTLVSLVSVAAMLFAPAAFAQGVVNGAANSYHVIGEKLDSGLGSLTAADLRIYMKPQRVAGEKLDSGLGELTAADLRAYTDPNHVAGQKLDSGLGDLTAADVRVYSDPHHVAGEKRDSGLGELTGRTAPTSTAVVRAPL